jgi:hypothetical protein
MKACIDLLDKRSNNFSDRPRFPMLELYVIKIRSMHCLIRSV